MGVLYILAFLFLRAFASPIMEEMVVHERVDHVSPEFVDLGPPEASTVLNLRINLASSDLPGLEQTLKEISDPSSLFYGNWLSKEQVDVHVRPLPSTSALVADWLVQHGVVNAKNISSAGDWIAFPVTVSAANRMLGANFSAYTHSPSGKRYIRTREYSIPAALRNNHIRLVHPTISFVGPVAASTLISSTRLGAEGPNSTATSYACSDVITPECLDGLYNIPGTAARNTPSTLAVTAFDNECATDTDLQTFMNQMRPNIPYSGFSLATLDGGGDGFYPGLEASLDIQYAVGVAPGISTTFMSVGPGNSDGLGGFLDVVNKWRADSNPPHVITTSYGFNCEETVPEMLARSLCDAYMALTAQGVSCLFSSGDGGVGATPGNQCYNFLPAFPSCPYVTIVGATSYIPEQGASFSAGGFSNYFPQQSWQSGAVDAYFGELGSQYNGRFNRAGRAFPDVSAQGFMVQIIQEGQAKLVEGTSCSSPIFAAIIALLNAELLNAGKPVLGFLNPWLYANPGAFNDIMGGNNPGCGTQGFSAINGWDPVTGLGTPDYIRMRSAAGLV
ncbi:family S53 protease [Mycena epipterygia]|nr:family S53 protease [Mycena epipterygia]